MDRTTASLRTTLTVGGDTGVLTELRGRAVPYGVPTDLGVFTEEFTAGAFTASLRVASNLPLLAHHDPEKIVGVAQRWDERPDGLHGVWRIGTDSFAQETARMVRDGMLNFLSIRFNPGDTSTAVVTRGPDGREHIRWRTARLIEVSLTPIPAYPTADVTGIRSIDDAHAAAAAVDQLALEFTDYGPALLTALNAGTAADRRTAASLIRTAVETHGATDASRYLDHLAAGIYVDRPALALNLARAARLIDRDHLAPQLRDAHLQPWRDLLPADVGLPPVGKTTGPRRRRPRS